MAAHTDKPTTRSQPCFIKAAKLSDELARWENEGGALVSAWIEERLRCAQLAEDQENALGLDAGIVAQ